MEFRITRKKWILFELSGILRQITNSFECLASNTSLRSFIWAKEDCFTKYWGLLADFLGRLAMATPVLYRQNISLNEFGLVISLASIFSLISRNIFRNTYSNWKLRNFHWICCFAFCWLRLWRRRDNSLQKTPKMAIFGQIRNL